MTFFCCLEDFNYFIIKFYSALKCFLFTKIARFVFDRLVACLHRYGSHQIQILDNTVGTDMKKMPQPHISVKFISLSVSVSGFKLTLSKKKTSLNKLQNGT